MSTPLASEPMPGDGQVPVMSTLANRLYQRIPEVYRVFDARDSTWAFKRYLGAVLDQAGAIDDIITRLAGDDPIGPALPEPWGLAADRLLRWRAARVNRKSALGDPDQADVAWLAWLAQLVGARLSPYASEAEQRDTIRYATSGYRAGTRQAIIEAARSALTGSRYANLTVPARSDGGVATAWDILITTRSSETPDPDAVLGAVIRKGAKPAGAVLWHQSYETSWDTVEAAFTSWNAWEAAGWTRIEEAGLTYADVPDNLLTNPSFEDGTAGWAGLNAATLTQISGGVDSLHAGRVTSTTAVSTSGLTAAAEIAAINDERSYEFSASIKPQVAVTGAAFLITWSDAAHAALSTTSVAVDPTAGQWNRVGGAHLAPVGAAYAQVSIDLGTLAATQYADIDAALFRLIGV